MCGIAGYLSYEGNLPDVSQLKRMCDRMVHRGPDGYGFYQDEFIGLGHRRLSIIDVAGGKQPLGNEDGTIYVTFNGEIYNYRELRQDLRERGHSFATNSDTEVLVHLYEDVGERTPEYLRGMFAFAIWDRRKRCLFLARDRFGEKPLYYSTSVRGFWFCFASELKALAALPSFAPPVDGTSLADFLALGYVPDPKTIYAGVSKLLPGHSLIVTSSGERLRKYWAPDFSAPKQADFTEAVERIGTIAADAVHSQMISEVPLGAFLSGGVDSSAVVAFMAQRSAHKVKTFSIGFTSKAFNEVDYARLVSSRYSTDHQEHTVNPRIQEILPTLVNQYDEPFADPSAVPMLYLARMTSEHVTVVLSGDGADEVFGGYRRYFFGVLEERIRRCLPDGFRKSIFAVAGRYYPKFDYLPRVFRAKTTLLNLAGEMGDSYFNSISAFRDANLVEILSPDMRRIIAGYDLREQFRTRFQAVKYLTPLEQMQAVDYQTYLPGDILVKVDRATMAFSVESRAPWLDHRIAGLANNLPQSFKLHGKTGKHVFKEAVRPHLPARVIRRTKMGFGIPLSEWLRASLKTAFELFVFNQDMEAYLSLEEARRIWREHQSGLHDHSRKLWSLLMLAAWNERHYCRHEQTRLVESVRS